MVGFCMAEDLKESNKAHWINPLDFAHLSETENQVEDVLVYLDSTLDTVITLAELYRKMKSTMSPSFADMNDAKDNIQFILNEKAKEVASLRKQAEALLLKANNTHFMVSIVDQAYEVLGSADFHSCRHLVRAWVA